MKSRVVSLLPMHSFTHLIRFKAQGSHSFWKSGKSGENKELIFQKMTKITKTDKTAQKSVESQEIFEKNYENEVSWRWEIPNARYE
jgi:hypothetical protein